MAINTRHPLVKRPLMMAGIEGGAILLLTLVASQGDFGQAIKSTAIAAALAAIAGLFVGAVEMSTSDKKSYAPRPKAKKKKDEEEEAKPAPAKPATMGAQGDADRAPSWTERATAKREAGDAEVATASPPQPVLPVISTSTEAPAPAATDGGPEPAMTSPPSQPMAPTPSEPSAPAASTPPAQPPAPPSDAADLLSNLLATESAPPPPATEPAPPPAAAQSAPPAAAAPHPPAQAAPPAAGAPTESDFGIKVAIVHPEQELRAHIKGELVPIGADVVIESGSPQEALLGLLDHEPDLIVTGVPLNDPEYFQKLRKASPYAMIVVYGDDDVSAIPEVAGRWEPWTPVPQQLRASIGLADA